MYLKSALLALSLLLVPHRVLAVSIDELKPAIDEIIQPLLDEKKTVGVVVGVVNGKITGVFGYGTVAKGLARSPDGDTVFEIGSITKVFTAIVLADMVRNGTVKLEDPVRAYLPAGVQIPTSGSRQITLLDLATHHSGLPRMPTNFHLSEARNPRNPYKHYTLEDLYSFLSEYKLPRQVGSAYEYSNLGFALLGQALSRKAGMSFEQLVLERVCKPLGLKDTCQTLSPGRQSRLARGYDADLSPTSNWDLGVFAGAGGLCSTANDMLRFAAANLGLIQTSLQPTLEAAYKIRADADSRSMHMALGWHVWEPPGAKGRVIWHNGGTGGYHSYLGFIKETETAVVVLSNSVFFTDAAAIRILKLLNPGWK